MVIQVLSFSLKDPGIQTSTDSGSRFHQKDYDKGERGKRLLHSGRMAPSRRKTLTLKTAASPKLERKGVSVKRTTKQA